MVATLPRLYLIFARPEMLVTVNVKITVFWDVNVGKYVSLHGIISLKITIFMYLRLTST
jgi:hypothetical protein